MSPFANRPLQLGLLVVVLAGCGRAGPEVAPVSGRVTLDGRPLESADLMFQVEGKSPGVGRTDQDGRYELMYKRGVAGTPIGSNRVAITVSSELVSNPPPIPARYNTETELTAEVQPGEDNVFNFDLTSDRK
jgi:hypothetical protein